MSIVSIIIVTFNSEKYIEKLLESIVKFNKGADYEIIVVDNNSKDKTVKLIQNSKFKTQNYNLKLKIIENKENFGFAKGINIGAKKARGKYLLFINPDTQWNDGSINDLISLFEKDEDIGIVGGKIVNESGKPENSSGKFLGILGTFFLSLGLDEIFNYRFSPKREEEVDFVSGGFMMVRSDIFKKLSGFDENYFMYVEDMDLCFRAMKQNYKIYFSLNTTIIHEGQGSSSRSFAIKNIYKSLLYFQKKHGTKLSYFLIKSLLVLKASVLVLLGKIINNKYLVLSYKEALKSIV